MHFVLKLICILTYLGGIYGQYPLGQVKLFEECRRQLNATEFELSNVLRRQVPKNNNEACLLACTMKKLGFMADNNKINVTSLLKTFENLKERHYDIYQNVVKVYNDCKVSDINEKDQCNAAKKYAECVFPKEVSFRPPPPHYPPRGSSYGNIITQCKNQTSANQSEVTNVARHQIPQTRNEQCFLACIEKKRGIMKADNKIDYERIKLQYGHMQNHDPGMYKYVTKLYDECKVNETAEKDECTAAKKFAECIYPRERMMRPPSPHDLRIIIAECRNKTGATSTEAENARRQLPKTKNEQCMLACIFKATGIFGSDNKVNMDRMRQNVHLAWRDRPDLIGQKLLRYTKCKEKETTEKDECVAAKKFVECLNSERDAEEKGTGH